MSSVTRISVPQGSYYCDLAVLLGGTQYTLTMRWNTRSALWFCDINDVVGNLIVGGISLGTGRDVLAPYRPSFAVPKGALYVADTTGKGSNAGKGSFSSTHELLFYSP